MVIPTRQLVWTATFATLILIAGAGAYLLRDPLPRILARRSALMSVVAGTPYLDRGYELRQVRLTATSGLSVELTLRRSAEDTGPLPLVIILGGHHTGRDAVRPLD